MSQIVQTKISSIDPNPFRQLATYPYNEEKLSLLERSINDVGVWERLIARLKGNRAEIAFGHHLIKAATNVLGANASVPVIIRDLDDEQMLKFMGRENMEEYAADFLIMLETWEAAEQWLFRRDETIAQRTDVARFLGWTRPHPQRDIDMVSDAAAACASASELLKGGYFQRKELNGLTVGSARLILERVVALQKQVEKDGKAAGAPAREIEHNKKIAAGAGKIVAGKVRSGSVANRDIRSSVGSHAYTISRTVERKRPLFDTFGKTLADQIHKIAVDDSIGEKLRDLVATLKRDGTTGLSDEDTHLLTGLAHECDAASDRFDKWATALTPKAKKAPAPKPIPFKQIGGRR